jgi:hypothetical protein
MEKIILLTDALNFKAETLDFAGYISKLGKSKIVGVFVESRTLEPVPSIKTMGGTAYVEEITADEAAHKADADTIQKNIATFKGGCIQREVMATVHHDKGNPLETIIDESRYADMIIADPSLSFTDDRKVPSKFMMEIISRAECPVLIAPEYFEPLEEIVFAYDGSRSSVFAIKQFYYQLPKLADRRVIVLHINKEGNSNHKEYANFREWLDMHFPKVTFLELTGEPREVLFEYFMVQNEHNNQLLVTGAFGRNFLSTFFKPSAAELVLKAVDIPIFITHH